MSMRQEILDLAARTRSFSQRIARETVTGAPSAVAPLLVDMVRRGQLVRVGFGAYAAPDRAEEARQYGTDGPVAQAILRALSKSPNLQMVELKRVAHAHSGGETVAALVAAMVGDGLLSLTTRGYALTSKGAKRIPSAPPVMPEMRPYRPPQMPPRRPGAMDFVRAPSVYSGAPA